MTNDKTQIDKPVTEGADVALKISKLLKKLIECLTQETLALQSHNRTVAERMSQEKSVLMHNYKTIQKELSANPDLFQNLDKDVKAHLKGITTEFEIVLNDNIMAIQSGKNAVTRLIGRILDKAREAATLNPKSYNANGRIIENNTKSTMTPTKLNETY